jgi:phytoene synthase
MDDAFAYCEALVRAADPDRALATVFAPTAQRPALYSLYAFNAEVARVREAVKEPLAGEVRLQWWREVIAGGRDEEAHGHPIASALSATIKQYELPLQLFDRIIAGRYRDLADSPMNTLDELEDYCRETSATVMELAACVLTPSAEATFSASAGVAYAMTGLLRAFPLHGPRRGTYVPREVYEHHRTSPAAAVVGYAGDELRAVLETMREQAAAHYRQALPAIAAAPPAVAAAWLPAALVPLYLRALERGDPFHTIEVSAFRRTWALWRAVRKGRPADL